VPFNAALVGARWGPIDWMVTPRRALAFRAVLAPDDAVGLDDAAGPLTALPMQVVSPEWVLALMARDHPDQTLTPEEQRRGVHATQDTRFLAPIPAGEVLSVSGELTGVRASRAGAVATTRYETRGADGGLLAVSLSTSIMREVAVAGEDRPPPEEPEAASAFEAVGAAIPIRTPRGFPHQYSECAEIWNPIHTERQVALAAGLPDILIHGTALWAFAGLHLTPNGGQLKRLSARFRSPAWAGAPMLLRSGEIADGRLPFRLEAEDGRLLTDGFVER
jgi:acyl dehydratase